MKRLFAIAALLLASSAAHAGDSYSFEVGGRTIHIDAPDGCDSPSCVSVSIPGVYERGPKRTKRARVAPDGDKQAPPQAKVEPQAPAPAKAEQSPAPAGGTAPAQAATTTTATTTAATLAPSTPAPAPAPQSRASEPVVQAQPAPAPAPAVVATAPVAAQIQKQQAPTAAASRPANSPLGIWQTEEKEGLVRIEPCGSNICGYSVDAKTNQNGEKILINMKPVNDKWTGRIHDPDSGSNYDSTIALKGPDTLRVQGCAFGGMFCGGQTWTRVN